MSTLLHIDSSARGERSVSRQLTREFAAAWQQAHPGGRIIYRDLGHNHVPLMSENFIAAAYTPPDALSPQLREALAISNDLIGELETANEYVFGVPMYNFSVPAAFKAYIDQIVRVGRTFAVDESGYKGLVLGKKATIITSSGGTYRSGSPAAPCNLQEPWIRSILGFIGVTDIEFVVADGLSEVELGKRNREGYLKPIRKQVQQKAALAA
ncbi:MAG TPA: FMN-dependent NADH-azoreductase [Chthoniobacterales bacterium]|nr:FMN-dependent NADH-azoreductase [Chthoniobacterales bacterium]